MQALRAICYRHYVCPSVRLSVTLVLRVKQLKMPLIFFSGWLFHYSSFLDILPNSSAIINTAGTIIEPDTAGDSPYYKNSYIMTCETPATNWRSVPKSSADGGCLNVHYNY